MTAQDCFDHELSQRDLSLLNADALSQVRRLLRHPHVAIDILHERLLTGCQVLDTRETEYRWQWFEALLTAWRCCQIDLERRRNDADAAYIEYLQEHPEEVTMRGRLRALNARSGREHLAYQKARERGQQVPLSEPETGKPMVTGPMKVTGRTNPKWQ